MEELRRRVASAKAWGIEDTRIITPAEVKELVPFIEESVIVGGFYTPSVGIVDSLRFGTIARERAQANGALSVFANTEVLGIDVEDGRIKASPDVARRDRDRGGRRLLRGVEPEDRANGGRNDSADARRAPDDRRRARAALQGHDGRDRVPDRARHGHEHVRAAGRERARDRLVCPSSDPARPRRDSRRTRRRRSRRPSSRSRRTTSRSRWRTRWS